MKYSSSGKVVLFSLISIFFLISSLTWIWLNYRFSLDTLQREQEAQNSQLASNFHAVMDSTASIMQLIASSTAGDNNVAKLFFEGKQMLETEDGGAGGLDTSSRRKELYLQVKDVWAQMGRDYELGWLHFYFGPGALSYLQVDRPDTFGERLDTSRYMVVKTNSDLTSEKGFETGLDGSGVRGVVPVFADDEETGRRIHVGALEAGAPLSTVLAKLRAATGYELSVLLLQDYLRKSLPPETVAERVKTSAVGPDYVLEASTEEDMAFLRDETLVSRITARHPILYTSNGRPFSLLIVPFRDYYQSTLQNGANVGILLARGSLTEEYTAIQNNLRNNILSGLLVFVLLEALLLLSWHLGTSRLRQAMHAATFRLDLANKRLEEEAKQRNRGGSLQKQSESLYRSMFEDNRAPMLLVEPETNGIVDCNQASCDFYQYGREELLIKRLSELMAEDEFISWRDLRSLLLYRDAIAADQLLANGELRHAVLHCSPLTQGNRTRVLLIVDEITGTEKADPSIIPIGIDIVPD